MSQHFNYWLLVRAEALVLALVEVAEAAELYPKAA
jgi:hypothetical protein